MINEGSSFKNIRQSRNITQKDICKQKISRTTLSKFENNKIMLSMAHFNYLLNSIDVSFEEFNFIENGYSYKDKEQIIYLFNKIFSNSDLKYLDNLITLCDNYLDDNFSKSIKCIRSTLYMLKHIADSTNSKLNCQSKLYAADVWDELSKVDSWTILDIKIINCCLHFFDPNTYPLISKQLIKSLDKYKNFSNIILLETSIYLNLTLLFSLQNDKKSALFFSEKALDRSFQSKRIDYISISLIRYGLLSNQKGKINDGLKILKLLNDDPLYKIVKEEVDTFII
ncbi:hypothetical protein IGL98_003242 [Enterococcus sp. DIV0840]|uniref:helix-turn-helix domain-containing protein n=1 Tax=Enterococcus TaxID=1350 RepID=UPI001A906363|nr:MULTISPECIES: helix-turn-helix transcriptional regulator [Enterococcus]MBO0434843.1 helix-turn-helix transcriptional regulator [Enterococcus sp. DIV0849a]MBO0475266.1 helix-turn-helix transcriptional regulator [Enterococcus ureasiticus]